MAWQRLSLRALNRELQASFHCLSALSDMFRFRLIQARTARKTKKMMLRETTMTGAVGTSNL
jgi:hypothetical protein